MINSTNKCNFDGRIVWLIISVQERQNSSIRSKGNNNNNCSPSKDQIDKSFNKERKYVKIMNNTSYFTIILILCENNYKSFGSCEIRLNAATRSWRF